MNELLDDYYDPDIFAMCPYCNDIFHKLEYESAYRGFCSLECFDKYSTHRNPELCNTNPNIVSCIKCGEAIQSDYWQAFCKKCWPKSVYVYEWYEHKQPFPFYVGTGSYSRVLEPHMNRERTEFAACEKKRMMLNGEIEYKILYEGLDRLVAEAIEYGLIKAYLSLGVPLTNELVKQPPFTNSCTMSGTHIIRAKDYRFYMNINKQGNQ